MFSSSFLLHHPRTRVSHLDPERGLDPKAGCMEELDPEATEEEMTKSTYTTNTFGGAGDGDYLFFLQRGDGKKCSRCRPDPT
jgi:hypothetical protein